jgi:methionyl-tRNA formyltransferase
VKILIFSLGEKGFNVIKALSSFGNQVSLACVIGEDKNVLDDYSKRLMQWCQVNEITYYFRNKSNIPIDGYDLYLAAGWRWMIQNISKEKLVVFHDSLLPRYRGFAPLVNALINKERVIGVTALLGSEEYDKGNIILQHCIDVTYPTNIEHEITRISQIYATMAIELVSKLKNDSVNIESFPQDESNASYSLWRDEQDYRINWSDTAENISHFINCLGTPYLGASTTLNDKVVRIHRALPLGEIKIENRTPGKVIFQERGLPIVVCGFGLLLIEDIRDNESKALLPLANFRSRFV